MSTLKKTCVNFFPNFNTPFGAFITHISVWCLFFRNVFFVAHLGVFCSTPLRGQLHGPG